MLRVLKLSHNSSSLRPQVPHDIKVHQCPPPSRIRVCPRNPTRHHNSQAARSWLQWSVRDSSWNSECSTSSYTNKYIGGRNWTLPKTHTYSYSLIDTDRQRSPSFLTTIWEKDGRVWSLLFSFMLIFLWKINTFLVCMLFHIPSAYNTLRSSWQPLQKSLEKGKFRKKGQVVQIHAWLMVAAVAWWTERQQWLSSARTTLLSQPLHQSTPKTAKALLINSLTSVALSQH